MATASGQLGGEQVPQLFVPNSDHFERLTEEAKQAIRSLAALLRQNKVDIAEADYRYRTAAEVASGQPEPKILFGLTLLKAKDRGTALQCFEDLKSEYPDLLLSRQAIAWLRFGSRDYKAGVEELVELATNIRESTDASPGSDGVRDIVLWIGQLREFAATAIPEAWRPSPSLLESLDEVVAGHGKEMEQCYREGRAQTQAVVDRFHSEAGAADSAAAAMAKIERRQLRNYAAFPFKSITDRCLAGLDR